jgi:hypothetical protein
MVVLSSGLFVKKAERLKLGRLFALHLGELHFMATWQEGKSRKEGSTGRGIWQEKKEKQTKIQYQLGADNIQLSFFWAYKETCSGFLTFL